MLIRSEDVKNKAKIKINPIQKLNSNHYIPKSSYESNPIHGATKERLPLFTPQIFPRDSRSYNSQFRTLTLKLVELEPKSICAEPLFLFPIGFVSRHRRNRVFFDEFHIVLLPKKEGNWNANFHENECDLEDPEVAGR